MCGAVRYREGMDKPIIVFDKSSGKEAYRCYTAIEAICWILSRPNAAEYSWMDLTINEVEA